MNRVPFPSQAKPAKPQAPEYELYYSTDPEPQTTSAKPAVALSALDLMYAYYDQDAA